MGIVSRTLRNLTLKKPRSYGYRAVDNVRDILLKTDYERFPDSKLDKV